MKLFLNEVNNSENKSYICSLKPKKEKENEHEEKIHLSHLRICLRG